jgi:hypothetical protein
VTLERAGKVSEQRDDVVQQIGCVSGGAAVREQHFGQVVAKATTGESAVGRARGAEGIHDVSDVGIAALGYRGLMSLVLLPMSMAVSWTPVPPSVLSKPEPAAYRPLS